MEFLGIALRSPNGTVTVVVVVVLVAVVVVVAVAVAVAVAVVVVVVVVVVVAAGYGLPVFKLGCVHLEHDSQILSTETNNTHTPKS